MRWLNISGNIQRYSTIREWSLLLLVRTGRETREDDTSNKNNDRKREKGSNGKKRRREGETGGRKKEGLSVVRDVLVLRHMESRALGLVAITMRRALEFEISRIGARSIHLRDNIFRSKYEYYIISAVDAGFSPFLLPPCSSPRVPIPLSSSPSRVFISLLLQSAPTAAIFILLFLSFHLSRCQSECLHYKKNWASRCSLRI